MFEDLPEIKPPVRKQKKRKVKALECDCFVEHEPQFEDLVLYTKNCEIHSTIFDLITVFVKGRAKILFDLMDAWRDYIWQHGKVTHWWDDEWEAADEQER